METTKAVKADESLSTEDVIAFLRDNPDFFKINADLMADLNFVHDTQGGAVSLIQRQVGLLREHLAQNRERLAELARNANHNESLLKRFQELSVALASAKDQNHTVTILQRIICLEFGLGLLEIVTPKGFWKEPSDQVIELSAEEYRGFNEAIYDLPLFLGKPPEKIRDTFFADKNELTRSIALIKVQVEKQDAYLLIGSKDENHFQNDMGTEFVNFLGAYVTATLSRFD